MRARVRAITLVAALTVLPSMAGAQVSSSLQQVALGAIKGQSVTLGAPSPSSQGTNIVDAGISEYPQAVTLTVAWDVTSSSSTTVKLVGYFPSPTQALAFGTSYIPSSAIEASTDGGTTWLPFTSSAVGGIGSAGGSLTLYTSAPTQGSNSNSSASVSFKLRLNLTAGPATLAGIYSGTLYLMAIAN